MRRNNVYTVNPILARSTANINESTGRSTSASNMSVSEKAVLSSVQTSIQPNQLSYSYVSVDSTILPADTTTSTLSLTYEKPLNVSISNNTVLFKLIQDETQMFVSKAQVEEWTAKASADHNHDASDIITGVIAPEVLANIPMNKILGLENELSYLRNVTLNGYTKPEIDTKLLDIQTSLAGILEDITNVVDNPIWKNPVETYAAIATTYPTPDPGWVTTVQDTSIMYLYTNTGWLPISSNSIPEATQLVAGLLSADDKIRLDQLVSGGGGDGAATTLGGFTQDYFLNRSATAQTKVGDLTVGNLYSTGAVVAHMTNEYTGLTEPIAGTSVLGFVKVDGTTVLIDADGTIHAVGSGAGTWNELSGKPADLVAIAALSGTSGFLKKTGTGAWALDTNTYATSSSLNNYLLRSGGTVTGTITSDAYNTVFLKLASPTASYFGGFMVYEPAGNEAMCFGLLTNQSTFKFKVGTVYFPPTITVGQFTPDLEIGNGWAKVAGNTVWHAGNFNAATFNAASATYASTVTLTADNSTNATNYPLFVNAATGNLSPRTDTGFTYNPSTGTLTTTTFSGNLSGNVTGGTISGTTGSFSSTLTSKNHTVSGNTYSMLMLTRDTANGSNILFGNSGGNLGKIGFDNVGNLIIGTGASTDGVANIIKGDVNGNVFVTGAVVAHATGSWTNTLPIASTTLLGTVIAGTSLNVTAAGLLNIKVDHYTTTSGYTSRVCAIRTFELSMTAGTLSAGATESYSLTNFPISTVFSLTATATVYTSTTGSPINVTVKKGATYWEVLLYNTSTSAITKTADMKVNIIGLITI